MGLGPTVGAQRGQIPLATQQAVEHVFHVQPDVQMVAMSRAKRLSGNELWKNKGFVATAFGFKNNSCRN
jgi:hypothetical protein